MLYLMLYLIVIWIPSLFWVPKKKMCYEVIILGKAFPQINSPKAFAHDNPTHSRSDTDSQTLTHHPSHIRTHICMHTHALTQRRHPPIHTHPKLTTPRTHSSVLLSQCAAVPHSWGKGSKILSFSPKLYSLMRCIISSLPQSTASSV